MKKIISQILKQKLNASVVEVQDDSSLHAGHSETQKHGGGHYTVLVVSEQFQGHGLIKRHRMVYSALAEIKDKIHALSIRALTTKEI